MFPPCNYVLVGSAVVGVVSRGPYAQKPCLGHESLCIYYHMFLISLTEKGNLITPLMLFLSHRRQTYVSMDLCEEHSAEQPSSAQWPIYGTVIFWTWIVFSFSSLQGSVVVDLQRGRRLLGSGATNSFCAHVWYI